MGFLMKNVMEMGLSQNGINRTLHCRDFNMEQKCKISTM
jgi:hypothetical protein